MRTFLVIYSAIVKDIVKKEGDFDKSDTTEEYDTIAEDFSDTYVIGDTYKVYDWLSRNSETVGEGAIPSSVGDRYSALWSAARGYELEQWTGSINIIISVLLTQNNEKAKEVHDWINSIWELYYIEKDKLDEDPDYISEETFMSCGDAPYTAREIFDEYKSVQG